MDGEQILFIGMKEGVTDIEETLRDRHHIKFEEPDDFRIERAAFRGRDRLDGDGEDPPYERCSNRVGNDGLLHFIPLRGRPTPGAIPVRPAGQAADWR